MQQRCQIYISSSYMDLIEERKIVIESVLHLGQFPMGAEFLKATNVTQFDAISKCIKESDCVILVVGKKYGSIYPDEGVSYTEAEYNYALTNGIPVLVFIKNIDANDVSDNLKKFRQKLLTNTTVSFWNDEAELDARVSSALAKFLLDYLQDKKFNGNNIVIGNGSNVKINTYDDEEDIDSYKENLKNSLGIYTAKENNDILGLMINNLGEIKQFYKLTKSQAENAYKLAKNSSIAGIVLIAVAVLIALIFNNNQIAVATTIGGVIVEVLAGTSLFVYQKTLKQLNYYYASLHNNERFLSIINIVGKTNIKDELYQKIVESELENLKHYEIRNDKSE